MSAVYPNQLQQHQQVDTAASPRQQVQVLLQHNKRAGCPYMNPRRCSTGAGGHGVPTAQPAPAPGGLSAPAGPATGRRAGRGPHGPPHTGSPTSPCPAHPEWLAVMAKKIKSSNISKVCYYDLHLQLYHFIQATTRFARRQESGFTEHLHAFFGGCQEF